MRVLLINHFPLTGSGSGVYTENIANSLVEAGNEVCVIYPENEKEKSDYKFKNHPVYFQNNEDDALPFNFPCFTTHPRSNKTFYELTNLELEQYVDAFRQAIGEEVSEFKPDVIHCGHIWILASIASEFNIPLVITAHGTDLIGYDKSPRFRDYALNAFESASAIITISLENSNLVKKIFGAENKIKLISNGYDANVFYKKDYDRREVLKSLGIEKEYQNIVSFAGKFTYFKGIDVLLKAAKIYEDENTLTLLAGNGELFEEMKRLAQKLNLKNVKFLGNQSHETLNKIYNIADVSLVPSRNEAFGLVVIEALACGAPVIGTNDGGIKDIITNDTGLLCPVDDYNSLAHLVKFTLENKEHFNRDMISKYAKENYSQNIFTRELLDIYNNSQKNVKI